MPEIQHLISSRSAEPADDSFLLELYASTRADLALLDLSEPQKQLFIKMQFEAQRRAYLPADHQIICLQGRAVGRTLIQRSDDELRLVDISILPDARNRGLGAYFIKELLAEARQHNKPVKLRVLITNPARRLYERLGFSVLQEDSATPGVHAYLEMIWNPQNGN